MPPAATLTIMGRGGRHGLAAITAENDRR